MKAHRSISIMALLCVIAGFFLFSCSGGDDDDNAGGNGGDDTNVGDDTTGDDDTGSGDDSIGDDDGAFGLLVCSRLTGNELEMDIVTVNAPMAPPSTLVAVVGHSAIDPVITPDGQTVVFSANFENATPNGNDPPGGCLYQTSLAKKGFERITDDDWMQIYERSPAISPDGATIVFMRSDKEVGPLEALGRLWMVQLDGSDKHPVFDDQVPRNDWAPAFSPDGTRLAYLSDHNESLIADVMLYNLAAGGDPVNLTNYGAGDSDALFTPFFDQTGQWVYYVKMSADSGNAYGLYRVSSSGGDPELVFDIPLVDMPNHSVSDAAGYSDFKPTKDGSHFALTGGINDAYQVFTADSLTSPFSPSAVTDATWDCIFPYWYRP